ncbi:MAG TPA: polysaccharide deacetylase family protein [bacterium]|nr:polysaccharide deacetylase family protein [bacterium]
MTTVVTGKTVVLCYHNVVPDDTPRELEAAMLGVRRSNLEAQLRFLRRRLDALTFEDLEHRKVPRRGMIVTFDDGYRAILTHALPLLRSLDLPAYAFVNPAFVGGWNPRDQLMGLALYGSGDARRAVGEFLAVKMPDGGVATRARHFLALRPRMWQVMASRAEGGVADIEALFARHGDSQMRRALEGSRLLSWDDVQRLSRWGVRIGNHTRRHLELDALPRPLVRWEIQEGAMDLRRHLGTDLPVISYPRGKCNDVVREEAAAAGYRWGLLSVPGSLSDGRPTLTAPRVLVSPGLGVLGLLWKMSRVRQWAGGVRRWR